MEFSIDEENRNAIIADMEKSLGRKLTSDEYNTIMGNPPSTTKTATDFVAELNAPKVEEPETTTLTPPVADTPIVTDNIPIVTDNTPTVTEPSDAYKEYLSYTDKYNSLIQGYLNGSTDAAKYTGLAKNYIDQYLNRGDFSYDINTDEMYAMYRDQYLKQAQQAQQDATAQAAALTGGYGSSYASAMGQNAYNSVMDSFNTKALELYENAYNRYQQEGQNLLNAASLAQTQADTINQKTLSDAQLYQALGQQKYQESSEYQSAVAEENSKAAWDSLNGKLANNATISGKYKMQKDGKQTGVLGIANAIDLERDLIANISDYSDYEAFTNEVVARLQDVSIGGQSMSVDDIDAYLSWMEEYYKLHDKFEP